jgi:hypothetical protein
MISLHMAESWLGLENRFGPLGPTRVQIPPPPLDSQSHQRFRIHLVSGDWVPVAAAAIGAAAGFGGAAITARATLAREREARYQQRKAEAYVELLANMNLRYEAVSCQIPFRVRHSTQMVLPPQVSPPDPSATGRVAALLAAYGSRRVRDELYPSWTGALRQLESFADRFRDETLELELGWQYQETCRKAEQAVAAQIRSELAPTARE